MIHTPVSKLVYIDKGATFSEDMKHRYVLWRTWDDVKKVAMCIGLNPSTANNETDDSTIRYLTKVLDANGYGGLSMVNCYTHITSKPEELPVGEAMPYAAAEIMQLNAHNCQEIIFCWGNFKEITPAMVGAMHIMFPNAKCFGKTKAGNPMHPQAFARRGMPPASVTLMNY